MKGKHFFGLLLALVLCIGVFPATANAASNVWDGRTSETFAGGNGSKSNPYQIANGAQLYYLTLQDSTNHYYKITNDIDLGNKLFPMIQKFDGTLDGNGHSILNLNISAETSYYAALIKTCTGTIKKLTIGGTIQSAVRYTAAFAGVLDGGMIQSCSNCCTIYANNATSGTDYYAGGIAGYVKNSGQIIDCANMKNIVGKNYAGGIAGYVEYPGVQDCDKIPSITGCQNTATVSGKTAGGICGYQFGTTISECANIGKVSGSSLAGGIVGKAFSENCASRRTVNGSSVTTAKQHSSFIHDCYNTGRIESATASGGISGSFAQCTESSGTTYTGHQCYKASLGLERCYNIGKITVTSDDGTYGDISGTTVSSNGIATVLPTNCIYLSGKNANATESLQKYATAYSSDELETVGPYRNNEFDFDSVWGWDNSGKYPYAILQRIGVPKSLCTHNWKFTKTTATCTEDGINTYTCSKCGDTKTEPAKAQHTLSKVNAVPGTCKDAGTVEHWHCSVCEKNFSDANGATELTSVSTGKNADNHVGGTEKKGCVPANCTTPGHEYDTYCKGCGEKIADGKTIPAQHTLSKVNAVSGTCKDAGTVEHWHCSVCEKNFSGANGATELTSVSTGKNANNHVGGTEIRNAKDATYTATGYTGDTYCLGCGNKIADGTVIPKKTGSSSNGGSSSGNSTYTIIVIKNQDGSISTDRKTASKGTAITVTVEPNAGHTLKTLLVTDRKGNELEVRKENDKYYIFTMPASAVTVQATFAKDNMLSNTFADVSADAYYYDAVSWAIGEEITSGINATVFNPYGICTRAHMVTFLWRSAGKPEPASMNNPFVDVSENAYYYKAVLWATEKGITKGTSETTFAPDVTCTRGQAVTFLYRYAGSPATSGKTSFVDVPETAFCYHAVIWAASEGITGGTSTTTFSPADFCTRAQIVTFLYRYQTK